MSPARRFRIYRRLLNLYPAAFRREYGEQLLQTIADMVDDAPSPAERFAVWLRISLDFPLTVCKEHFQVIGDRMKAKKQQGVGRVTLISTALFLLPIIIVTINRLLMLSGPRRGVPTYYLIVTSAIFPLLAVALAGSTLLRLWRGNGAVRPSLRQAGPLVFILLASLVLLCWIISQDISYYNLTH